MRRGRRRRCCRRRGEDVAATKVRASAARAAALARVAESGGGRGDGEVDGGVAEATVMVTGDAGGDGVEFTEDRKEEAPPRSVAIG